MTVLAQHDTVTSEADGSSLHWRNLSYDVGWEAGPGGVIRCRSVLNRRRDIFDAVEGLNLEKLSCEGHSKNAVLLLRQGHVLRHIEVRLPRQFSSERLYLTGQLQPDGCFVGTFTALHPRFDSTVFGEVALLSQMTQARNREETYRREAEAMLEGLRILLGQEPALEKLEALATLMARAINGAPHLLLRVSRTGVPQRIRGDAATLGDANTLADLFRSLNSAVSVLQRDSIHAGRLRRLLDIRNGEVAIISLPVASESIALLCAAERFNGDDIDFASRFALILRQALALKDEQDKLLQSTKMSALGQMSASLAHELRQPLNTISLTAQNLEMMVEDGRTTLDNIKPKIDRILGQVDRASQIMDRVRRFSRKGGEILAPVDLAQLAQGVCVLMEHFLMPAGIRLEIAIQSGLTVSCDAVKIEQVLVNLVRNAMDAIGGIGSITQTENGLITIRGEQAEHGVVLRVEDNGPGFPPDVAERPLETFFTTKDAEAGTGLGLSICHMIAREHAGKLELGNYSGGAYVALYLPERLHASA
jgi:signal transduction histidine kinase